MTDKKMSKYEIPHYTEHDLNEMDKDAIVWAYCLIQDRFERLRDRDYPDLEERFRILNVRMFGRSSEKSSILGGNSRRDPNNDPEKGDEATSDDRGIQTDGNSKSGDGGKGKRHPVRSKGCSEKVTDGLPVIDEDIELTASELEAIFGPDVGYVDDPNFEKTYDKVCTLPCTHYVVRYHIHVYRGGGMIVPAAHVEKMKKGSLQTPDLMAEIVNDRCVLQLPMNRIAQELSREGFNLTRQTMARWCIDFGTEYVAPMIFRMFDLIAGTGYVQADETPMIIGRTLDKRRQEARQWVFRTAAITGGRQIIVFYFDETRSTNVLRELFGSLTEKITIICDSYISYKTFSNEMDGLITIANCYTHSRRKFTDIIKAIPGFKKMTEEEKEQILSYQIVKIIDKIFKNERIFQDMSIDERLKRRNAESRSVVNDLFNVLKSIPESSFDKSSKLYEAVNYLTSQEENFRVFLKDGNVPVHNSSCEQAIIPFALGRNGWKCIDSIDGGITLGYFYSLTETAKANGAVPFYYLKYLFERLPKLFKENNNKPRPEQFDELMPWTDQYKSYEASEIESSHNDLIRLGKLSRSENSA
ncbi:MAG: IS66 family transposase [Lachnospiraceae bacterium]|nr:IS66 family transposase [Lachnospiraceae bacterium]